MSWTSVRLPLATRQRVNNMSTDARLPWDSKANLTSVAAAYIQDEEDANKMKALENTSRLFKCEWNGCDAALGSWELLRRHVGKVHCNTFPQETLRIATSSRPHRCHYASCQSRNFEDPWLLVEHVDTVHLESLKFRCPLACKQSFTKFQALKRHISSAHGKSITDLPRTQILPPPSRLASLPKLATDAPMGFEGTPQVKPCPTFNAAKVKRKSEADPWADFAFLDDGSETRPFAQLTLPPNGRIAYDVRPIPRGRVMYDGLQKPKGDAARIDGDLVGYEGWKRQFDRGARGSDGTRGAGNET